MIVNGLYIHCSDNTQSNSSIQDNMSSSTRKIIQLNTRGIISHHGADNQQSLSLLLMVFVIFKAK
jgi:hypothetical protein